MKRVLALFSLLVLSAFGCKAPQALPPSSSDAVQSEVRAALDQFSGTSGRGDLAGVLALFDEKADIMVVGSDKGEVFKGRAAIESWLSRLYKSNGFSWNMDRVEISHGGDTAWAFVEGKMNVADKTTGSLLFSKPYRFSAVLVKRGDRWVWRLFHGSAPGKE